MTVAKAWKDAYASDPKGIQAGWRSILGPMSFPRDLLLQLPKVRRSGDDEAAHARYDTTVNTFQEYSKALLENAPRRDCWVSWGRPKDYDAYEMTWAFGDIDDEKNLDIALQRARKYEEFAMTEFGVQPTAIFSCGKGFHMHFTHDAVPYRGQAYADSIVRLADPYRVYLDAGPLKHRKAKPRVPYSLNLKASGREAQPMFVVPVDLTWDLSEIVIAAKECRVTKFRIPHSRTAAKVIEPLAEKVHARLEAAAKKRLASGDAGVRMDWIEDCITFCNEAGPVMVDGRGRHDGRKRLLYAILVPALMHYHKADQGAVLDACKAWVASCGGSWGVYLPLVRSTIKSVYMPGGELLKPMAVPRWLAENPGLRFPRV